MLTASLSCSPLGAVGADSDPSYPYSHSFDDLAGTVSMCCNSTFGLLLWCALRALIASSFILALSPLSLPVQNWRRSPVVVYLQ